MTTTLNVTPQSTHAELLKQARDLGLPVTTNTRKPELVQQIFNHVKSESVSIPAQAPADDTSVEETALLAGLIVIANGDRSVSVTAGSYYKPGHRWGSATTGVAHLTVTAGEDGALVLTYTNRRGESQVIGARRFLTMFLEQGYNRSM